MDELRLVQDLQRFRESLDGIIDMLKEVCEEITPVINRSIK